MKPKKTFSKKTANVLSLSLAAALVVSAVSFTAFAGDGDSTVSNSDSGIVSDSNQSGGSSSGNSGTVSGSDTGSGTGTGSDTGSGTGSGTGTGSDTGSGTGTGTGSNTGSDTGTGTGTGNGGNTGTVSDSDATVSDSDVAAPSATLEDGTVLKVTTASLSADEKTALEAEGGSADGAVILDISRTDGSTDGGNVTATIPSLAGKKVKIYHIHGGVAEYLGEFTVGANGTVQFSVDSFSTFVFVPVAAAGTGSSSASSNTGTGGSSNSTTVTYNTPRTGDFSAVPIALVAVTALGATGAVIYKKRKSAAE